MVKATVEPYKGYKTAFDAACAEFAGLSLAELENVPRSTRRSAARGDAWTCTRDVKRGRLPALPQWVAKK